MTMAVAWIVLPIFLSLVSLGCGLLLETVSGMRLPGALLLPGGFIVVSIVGQFAHMNGATAPLLTPLILALSIAGYGVARPWKRFHLDRWLAAAAVGVYGAFGAPVLLSGSATFTGYIKLDDTAVFQSMLDRAASHAYDIHGVAAISTYWKALYEGYIFGYPLGSLLPLGNAHTILRVDTLWMWQPYLTFMAVLIALGLYQVVSGFVESRALRALVAFIGTQAALMYGYALWGGVKEMFVPVVVLFAACLVPGVRTGGPRQVIPLAAAAAAVLGGESIGGGVWIVPSAIAGAILLFKTRPLWDGLGMAGVYTVTALVLAIPILSVSERRLAHVGKFTSGGTNGQGNLAHPLSWWQLPGVWLGGDFKYAPTNVALTRLVGILIALAASFAVVMAWRRARWEIVAAAATAMFGCLVYVEEGSPWVGAKALAASSPIVLGLGLAGVAVLIESKRQVEGGIAIAALVVIAGAVLWSNVLQYHAVLLAPSARLMELEKIGAQFSGQGPALLTEYEPYAARHFLRGLDAEGASELRVNYVLVRDDAQGPKTCPKGVPGCYESQGVTPDVDEIKLKDLVYYRTLIVRRTGSESRPPSTYTLAWSGHYYDVWQRTGQSAIIEHMSLGSRFQPSALPDCTKVMALAKKAKSAHGVLATVVRPRVTIIEPDGTSGAPGQFNYFGETPGVYYSTKPYTYDLRFHVPSGGTYTLWVGGSFSSTVTAKIDGRVVGAQTTQTEWPGNFLDFGTLTLQPGRHVLTIKHDGPDWRPGSAALQPFGLGPFVIAKGNGTKGTDQQTVTRVPTSKARSLCGKNLDWIEAISG